MKYNTRFNPTANGQLHLGHLYVVLVNERVAHESGGQFSVRFEDNQIDTLYTVPPVMTQNYCELQKKALEWLGIPVEAYSRQSEMDLELKNFVARHGWWMPEYKWPYSIPLNPGQGDYNPEHGEWYPYAPYLTFCKVIYDELQGVNLLIRGDDLRSEFALYQYFRSQLDLPEITHYYLPRLYDHNGGIVSKFYGAQPLLEYEKNGWTPEDILGQLSTAVLRVPEKGWQLSNIKKSPRLGPQFSLEVGSDNTVSVGGPYGDFRHN